MKFIIFSLFLHAFIFIFDYTFDRNPKFQIDESGTNLTIDKVSMNFSYQNQEVAPKVEEVITESVEKSIEQEIVKDKIVKEEKKTDYSKQIQNKDNKNKDNKNSKNETKELNSDFIELSKGIYAAKNQGVKGLKYSFIAQPEPEYPLMAKRLSYSKEVFVKVRFLVDFQGNIEEIKFYGQNDKLGFQEEVKKALCNWKLTPITVNNKPIKLYFYKEFKFNKK
ncbi:energy transducer TonB [Cetobacterium sp. 2A]|uniref:energy transducer TonB n=1 Tax=Cetobacterium sp. 2A TaxID=2754723 RepID=UPI00163B9DCA|nr:energy transducer TonB [Cetobacterium sp. 2A]MBC2854893.1 energy transducer TonB [Cetobacterium sp. 2A]